jgi:hypothetical protein
MYPHTHSWNESILQVSALQTNDPSESFQDPFAFETGLTSSQLFNFPQLGDSTRDEACFLPEVPVPPPDHSYLHVSSASYLTSGSISGDDSPQDSRSSTHSWVSSPSGNAFSNDELPISFPLDVPSGAGSLSLSNISSTWSDDTAWFEQSTDPEQTELFSPGPKGYLRYVRGREPFCPFESC